LADGYKGHVYFTPAARKVSASAEPFKQAHVCVVSGKRAINNETAPQHANMHQPML
jgi:hypothetical protein